MKRILAAAVVLSCVVASALADENVRTAEAKLKEAGFYFGPVNGQTSSDFSAAVTRYQIRNGLQITGKLNEETSKALGVKPDTLVAVCVDRSLARPAKIEQAIPDPRRNRAGQCCAANRIAHESAYAGGA